MSDIDSLMASLLRDSYSSRDRFGEAAREISSAIRKGDRSGINEIVGTVTGISSRGGEDRTDEGPTEDADGTSRNAVANEPAENVRAEPGSGE